MSQADVLEFLRQHKGQWFTARELSEQMDSTPHSVSRCLYKLRTRSKFVNTKRMVLPGKTYHYAMYYQYNEK